MTVCEVHGLLLYPQGPRWQGQLLLEGDMVHGTERHSWSFLALTWTDLSSFYKIPF